ncbi:MAG: hypothetical protein ABW058_03570, partial [Methylobacterium sp.]
DAAPAWFREALVWEAAAAPTSRAIVYRERTIGSVTAWPDPMASAARLWRRTRLAGGLVLGLAAATLLLNWLAVTRLVAPVGRIVHGLENLDMAGTRPPLPSFITVHSHKDGIDPGVAAPALLDPRDPLAARDGAPLCLP